MRSVFALLLLCPLLALADQGAATRYLMTEPASLMDIGLLRLDQSLEEMSDRFGQWYETDTGVEGVSVSTEAEYLLEDDRIRIHVLISVESTQRGESGCRDLIRPMKGHVARLESRAFRHDGYDGRNRPKNLENEILNRTQILCHVFVPGEPHKDVTVIYSFEDNEFVVSKP